MTQHSIYFATNRDLQFDDQQKPLFGIKLATPASDLRFGKLSRKDGYETMQIYDEQLINKMPNPGSSLSSQEVLGSVTMFREIKAELQTGKDLIIYIHGYNNSFSGAVNETFSLQSRHANHPAVYVLFSWPSDGSLQKRAYASDRHDAEVSAEALSRGLQKFAHFLKTLLPSEHCNRRLHLMAHSMGVFALRHAIQKIASTTTQIRRVFDEIILFAADEDEDALTNPHKLGPLPQFGKRVSVYCNKEDKALFVSDTTKGNPDRLGAGGPENTRALSDKISVIDCDRVSNLFNDPAGHHYYQKVDEVRDDVLEVLSGKGSNFSKRAFNPETRRYILV